MGQKIKTPLLFLIFLIWAVVFFNLFAVIFPGDLIVQIGLTIITLMLIALVIYGATRL